MKNSGGYWGTRGSFRGNSGGSIQFPCEREGIENTYVSVFKVWEQLSFILFKSMEELLIFCQSLLKIHFISDLIKCSIFAKVSLLGVESLWGDCTFIPADWGL